MRLKLSIFVIAQQALIKHTNTYNRN